MLLTLTTTHQPATDLGYLLMKHPDRVHRFDLPYGTATVVFPEATERRCTAALLLEAGHASWEGGGEQLNRYVNDRPFAASSLLSAAMNRVFRTAARGECRDRPELAATPIPLEVRLPALRCKGGIALARRLFEPFGWDVAGAAVPLDPAFPAWGDSRYLDLTLTGTVRLADALNHLYVLIPVLDDAKHHWVAPDEIDKLLDKGEGWLGAHPERSLITKRFLAHQGRFAREAESRLESSLESSLESRLDELAPDAVAVDDLDSESKPLNVRRREAVLDVLASTGARSVLDLGCGAGALLGDLVRDRRYTRVVGADVSARSLQIASRRLHDRAELVQTALTYLDDRLCGFDAAVLMEVIEHVDEPRLPALCAAVFGHAAPTHVIVTTPNAEYNVRYESLAAGAFRHADHRFEWTRARFEAWANEVAATYGYAVVFRGVGDFDDVVGTPTQLALFSKRTEVN